MEKKKRDLISEITSVKSRAEFNSRYDLTIRLYSINDAIDDLMIQTGSLNNELLKYIPISTTACFEAFFRAVNKELIDFGKPYFDNIKNFNQANNIKLDFDIISAIQTKKLTIGDFISHLLPANNLNDINSNISTLIGADFLEGLKKHCINEDKIKSNEEFGVIITSINSTFELRHIFCHEFATNVKIDKDEILSNYKNCKLFLEYTNDYIWNVLYPNAPETQMEMNDLAYSEFEIKENELSDLINKISIAHSSCTDMECFDLKIFKKSIKQWEKYRKTCAEYQASCVTGGSMYSMIYAKCLESITNEKIESLTTEFEHIIKKYNQL